jgi:hypothetical protein
MKVQIRQGVFETNSSSTHSLSIISKEQSDLLDTGEVYINGYGLEIVTKEEVDELWEEYQKEEHSYPHHDKEEYRKKYMCALTMDEFEEFCKDNCYETLWETSPDNKWVAISLWGDRS